MAWLFKFTSVKKLLISATNSSLFIFCCSFCASSSSVELKMRKSFGSNDKDCYFELSNGLCVGESQRSFASQLLCFLTCICSSVLTFSFNLEGNTERRKRGVTAVVVNSKLLSFSFNPRRCCTTCFRTPLPFFFFARFVALFKSMWLVTDEVL